MVSWDELKLGVDVVACRDVEGWGIGLGKDTSKTMFKGVGVGANKWFNSIQFNSNISLKSI